MNAGAVTVISSATVLTVMLSVVAAMGVFNTVVLSAGNVGATSEC